MNFVKEFKESVTMRHSFLTSLKIASAALLFSFSMNLPSVPLRDMNGDVIDADFVHVLPVTTTDGQYQKGALLFPHHRDWHMSLPFTARITEEHNYWGSLQNAVLGALDSATFPILADGTHLKKLVTAQPPHYLLGEYKGKKHLYCFVSIIHLPSDELEQLSMTCAQTDFPSFHEHLLPEASKRESARTAKYFLTHSKDAEKRLELVSAPSALKKAPRPQSAKSDTTPLYKPLLMGLTKLYAGKDSKGGILWNASQQICKETLGQTVINDVLRNDRTPLQKDILLRLENCAGGSDALKADHARMTRPTESTSTAESKSTTS